MLILVQYTFNNKTTSGTVENWTEQRGGQIKKPSKKKGRKLFYNITSPPTRKSVSVRGKGAGLSGKYGQFHKLLPSIQHTQWWSYCWDGLYMTIYYACVFKNFTHWRAARLKEQFFKQPSYACAWIHYAREGCDNGGTIFFRISKIFFPLLTHNIRLVDYAAVWGYLALTPVYYCCPPM